MTLPAADPAGATPRRGRSPDAVIRHRPFGDDDPYKPAPDERFPRDPVAGDEVRVGFRIDAADGAWDEAWVDLEGPDGPVRVDAARVAPELWSALLPPLPAGAWSYRPRARGASGTIDGDAYPLPVASVHEVDALERVTTDPKGATLRLRSAAGAPATLRLRPSGPNGVLLELTPGDAAPPQEPDDAPAFRAEEGGGRTVLSSDGLEIEIDPAALELRLRRPGETAPRLRVPLRARWTQAPDGSAVRYAAAPLPLDPGEELYGLGERFVGPGLRGRDWDVRVYEEYKEQGRRSYLPVPFFVSSRAWGAWIETDAPSRLDARGDAARFAADADPVRPGLRQHLLLADEPYGVTAAFVGLTGAIALPPRWAFGPWMSANTWNSQAKAEEAVRRTVEEDVPATVLVLEAWSDESTFYVFNDAEHEPTAGEGRPRLGDFRFGGRWPDPKGMVDRCHDEGIRVLLWQIPVQKKLDAPHEQHDRDEAHMIERGYVVRNADGTPYRNKGWWFTDALVLDVTNPEACDWWFGKRRYLFEELGIDGMKTDGGEHLWGRDLRTSAGGDGSRGATLVNRYAQAYVDAYHGFVREMTGGDGLTFSRAGYTGAQRSPGHWAGDENSTWSAFRASIQAGLTAGLAGVSIWGWDIGGFSGEVPTVELYIRSTQMACFCPIMQYHSELHDASDARERAPWTIAERWRDPRALSVYRAYAKLRMRLLEHVEGEAAALAAEGLPLMRYPGLVWPGMREELMRDPDAYLFGRDLLVCPVLEKGARTREVVLPPGEWIDLWSGAAYGGGRRHLVPAPLERIPVFVRADSPRRRELLEIAAGFGAA